MNLEECLPGKGREKGIFPAGRSLEIWLSRSFLLVVAVFFGFFLFSHFEKILDIVAGVDPRSLLLPLVIFTAFVFSEAYINTLLVFNMSGKTPNLRGIRIIVLSFLARYTPGKIWVLSVRLGLFPSLGVGISQVLSATVLENIFVLGTGAIFFLFTISFYVRTLGVLYLAGSLVLLACMILYPGPVLSFTDRVLIRAKLQPLKVRVTRKKAAGYTVFYLLAWLLLGMGALLLCLAMGIEIPLVQAPYVAAAYIGSVTLGFAAFFAPGGLGVREGLFALALQQFTLPGNALTAAISARIILSLAELGTWLVIQSLLIFKEKDEIPGRTPAAVTDFQENRREKSPGVRSTKTGNSLIPFQAN